MDSIIFISNENDKISGRIASYLTRDGFKVGSSVGECKTFVAFITREYLASTRFQTEFLYANHSDKKCVNVLLEKVDELSVYLRGDSVTLDAVPFKNHDLVEVVYNQLRRLLTGGNGEFWQQLERDDYFTGRVKLLEEMKQFKRVCLHGISGVGKTSVVNEFVYRNKGLVRNMFWFDADNNLKVLKGVFKFASGIYDPQGVLSDAESAIQVFIQHVNQLQDVYVVFDNVSNANDALKLARLMNPAVNIIITTKLDLIEGFHMLRVSSFDVHDAKTYLRAVVRSVDDQSADKLIKQANELLPQELSLVAGLLKHNSKISLNECLSAINSATLTKHVLAKFDSNDDVIKVLKCVTLLDPDYIPASLLKLIKLKQPLKQTLQRISNSCLCTIVFPNTEHFGIRVHRLLQGDMVMEFDSHADYEQIKSELVVIMDIVFPQTSQNYTKEWQEANSYAHHVIKLLDTIDPSKTETINLRSKLANYLINTQQVFKTGLAIHMETLETARSVLGAKHATTANILVNIGNTLSRLNENKNSLKYLLEALELKKCLNADPVEIAETLNCIAAVYERMNNSQKALECKLQALDMKRKVIKNDHADIAQLLHDIGILYGRLGKAAKSLEFFHQALGMREKLNKGTDNADIASTLNGIATAYAELGNDSTSLQFTLQALEMRKRLFRNNAHPEIADSLNDVGISYDRLENHQKALEFKIKALEMRQQCFKTAHPDIAESLQDVGISYGLLDDNNKALEFLQEALAMRQSVYKSDHPKIADNFSYIANAHALNNENKDSLDYHVLAYEMRKRLFKDDHPDVAKSLMDLSHAYSRLNQNTDSDTDDE